MVEVMERTEQQTSSEIELNDPPKTQIPQEMLTTDEHPLYEIRPLLWPYLARPSLVIIVGVLIAVFAPRIPLDILSDIEEWVELSLISSILGWIGIAVIGIGALSMIARVLRWRFTAYTITNLRILRQTGILARSYVDCSLGKVQTLYLRIPMMGRLFKFGTICMATAGTNTTEIRWEYVRQPKDTHRILNETMAKYGREGNSATS